MKMSRGGGRGNRETIYSSMYRDLETLTFTFEETSIGEDTVRVVLSYSDDCCLLTRGRVWLWLIVEAIGPEPPSVSVLCLKTLAPTLVETGFTKGRGFVI